MTVARRRAAFVEGRNGADEWWRDPVVYQIYPRSFCDGDGDGCGDLAGIRSQVGHLVDLGIDAVWINPFYPSPQVDHGYDVADYFDVDPLFGTLDDLDGLIDDLHRAGIRVLIDVVPNHSSSAHPWFRQALASPPGSPARDRYMFRFSAAGAPNNWGSMFGGPAWRRVDEVTGEPADRGWWYLHLFDREQPDFNWENEEVRAEFDRYLRFWCDRGVDGFRVDVAHALIKADGLPDDDYGPDRAHWPDPAHDGRPTQAPDTGPYFDQERVHDVYRRWRRVLDEYGPDRMLVAEVWADHPMKVAAYARPDEMNQSFNFDLLFSGWKASEVRWILARQLAASRETGATGTWVLSNHDRMRSASRLGYPFGAETANLGPTSPRPDAEVGLRRALALTLFLMALPGAMYVYNGEELGLPEVLDIPDDRRTDPSWTRSGHCSTGRDGCRVPIPWEPDGPSFGFSAAADPWLPQPADWGRYAVETQRADPGSVLSWYRQAIALRRAWRLGREDAEVVAAHPDLVAARSGRILAVVNMGVTPLAAPRPGRVLLTSSPGPAAPAGAFEADGGGAVIAPNAAAWILMDEGGAGGSVGEVEEFAGGDADAVGEVFDGLEGEVAFAAFDAAHEGAVDADGVGELFLAESAVEADGADVASDHALQLAFHVVNCGRRPPMSLQTDQ